MKSLMIVISTIYSFSPLGAPVKNYVTSAQDIPYEDCLTVQKNVSKHSEVLCIKEKPSKKGQ
jgi:hypothetical protein